VGLLPKGNDEQIPFAYKVYKSRDNDSEKLATHFKKTFGREVKIEFLGVWFVPNPIVGKFRLGLTVRHRDTVSSVGYLYSPATLPFVGSNHVIKTFRHALSLDEVRTLSRIRASIVHCLTYLLLILLRRSTFGASLIASRQVPPKFGSQS
jgi:uncharacterized protein (DUF2235 family)